MLFFNMLLDYRRVHPKHGTANYGVLSMAQGIGSVLGGPLAAQFHDQAHGGHADRYPARKARPPSPPMRSASTVSPASAVCPTATKGGVPSGR